MKCPPLAIDDALADMIEAYRTAKQRAAAVSRTAVRAETTGHYDKDTPLAQRAVLEGDEAIAERVAAMRLADELLQWVDKNRS